MNQWKDEIEDFDPKTSFTFYPQTENGQISNASVLWLPSSTDTEVGDKSSYSDNDKHDAEEKKEERKGSGIRLTPRTPLQPSEVPVLTIVDLPTIVPNPGTANWYLIWMDWESFFAAGNGWVFSANGLVLYGSLPAGLILWVYSEKLGWMWIKSEFPNMCFMEGDVVNGWSYFPKSSVTEAGLLYDYANQSWIKLN